MEILKLLQERHTTKKYDASRKISDADFDLLLESLRLAPSSVNSQPWEFFIADTKEAKEKLLPAIADFNHSRVTDSDRLIVCAIHTDLDESYMQELDDQEEADGRYKDPSYKVDNGQRRRFFVGKYRDAGEIACWAGKQSYIAQGFLLYTAAALGIQSTPIEGWDADKVDEILGLREKGMHAQYAVAHPTTIMPLARSPVGRHNASSTNFNAIRTSAQQSHAGRSSRFVPTCIFVN